MRNLVILRTEIRVGFWEGWPVCDGFFEGLDRYFVSSHCCVGDSQVIKEQEKQRKRRKRYKPFAFHRLLLRDSSNEYRPVE